MSKLLLVPETFANISAAHLYDERVCLYKTIVLSL